MPSNKSTKLSHPNGWTVYSHYSNLGCHAVKIVLVVEAIYISNKIDTDAYLGLVPFVYPNILNNILLY